MVGGQRPFGVIDMGGMFTVLKVRRDIAITTIPGWYENPKDTVAEPAAAEDLRRDGIEIKN